MAKFSLKPAEIGEAVSLGASIVIILSLAGYLAYAALRPQTEQLAVSSTAGTAREAGNGQYVIPVDIRNNGTRGITALHLDIRAGQRTHMIDLQYLAAGAQRRVYVYAPDAAQTDVTVTPLSYHID